MATSGAPSRDSSVICVLIVKSLEAENLLSSAPAESLSWGFLVLAYGSLSTGHPPLPWEWGLLAALSL